MENEPKVSSRAARAIDLVINLIIAGTGAGLVGIFDGPRWAIAMTFVLLYMICTRQHG